MRTTRDVTKQQRQKLAAKTGTELLSDSTIANVNHEVGFQPLISTLPTHKSISNDLHQEPMLEDYSLSRSSLSSNTRKHGLAQNLPS